MRKYVVLVFLFLGGQIITGCGSDAHAQIDSTSESVLSEYDSQSGSQTDIFHQKIEVINSSDDYNELWLGAPSIESLPTFDEDMETLVVVTSPAVSCGFSPTINSVIEQDNQMLILVGRVYHEAPEACNPIGYPIYGYSWIKIAKSSKLMGVVFEL